MITNFFIPELNNHDVQELWFQQDGATCHTARATIDLLKDTFGERLISRFGPVNWPPRSCDLTPLDYFLWGYVKSLVYADKPQTLDHLEDNIPRVIADIRPQMLEKVIENWTSRLTTSEPADLAWIPREGMGVCKCIVPLRHGDTLNSRRATSPPREVGGRGRESNGKCPQVKERVFEETVRAPEKVYQFRPICDKDSTIFFTTLQKRDLDNVWLQQDGVTVHYKISLGILRKNDGWPWQPSGIGIRSWLALSRVRAQYH
ncbi:uncharacterized protein TNCV_31721 [Trichonephila clavipes]|nr:uncharacterized protein TNCV_31721 [Trichonephila clavipes]